MTLTCIDLFCGAGGLSEGFRQMGFKTLFANDLNKDALKTFARNHESALIYDNSIEDIDASSLRKKLNLEKGELDVIIGGPPCQGFSTYGKRDPEDLRNQLYKHYIRFLEEFKPKSFVIENVVGILSMLEGNIIEDIIKSTTGLGYSVNYQTLDSSNFGVPQHRKRVFILGSLGKNGISFPQKTHEILKLEDPKNQLKMFSESPDLIPAVTVKEAISDLPPDVFPPKQNHDILQYLNDEGLSDYQKEMRKNSNCITHHSSKQMLGIRRLRLALLKPGDYGTKIRERISKEGLPEKVIDELLNGGSLIRDISGCRKQDIEKETKLREVLNKGKVDVFEVLSSLDSKGFSNKYRRLNWNTPSHTLVAHMARDCSDFVHPDIDRFISVREAARLQSFPDHYYFVGSQFQQFKQIGNAVPPLLAKAIARSVNNFLNSKSKSKLKDKLLLLKSK